MLTHLHDLHFYSEAWNRAVSHPRMAEAMADLIGPNVELHHTTLHCKPPETGMPFPMHQDLAFYDHQDGRYVDVLVHLNDTCSANGELRFVDGSHKLGPLEHIRSFINDRGEKEECTPHLPWERFPMENTVPVPAKAGDIVVFNIYTVHGSFINTINTLM